MLYNKRYHVIREFINYLEHIIKSKIRDSYFNSQRKYIHFWAKDQRSSQHVSNHILHSDLHINTVSKTVTALYELSRKCLSSDQKLPINELNSDTIPRNSPR